MRELGFVGEFEKELKFDETIDMKKEVKEIDK